MTVSKADKAAPDFTLAPLPGGQERRSRRPQAADARSSPPSSLDDVRADKDTDKAVKAGAAEAATFDGLTLKAELLAMDGGTWLRLKASAAEGSAAAAEAKTINDRDDRLALQAAAVQGRPPAAEGRRLPEEAGGVVAACRREPGDGPHAQREVIPCHSRGSPASKFAKQPYAKD